MPDLRTSDLERELSSPYADVERYLSDNASEMYCGEGTFAAYMRSLFKAHNTKPQIVFSRGDIPLRYGYRLISGEKHTRQRDVILRICFAADFSLDETQRALQIYGMSRLYLRITYVSSDEYESENMFIQPKDGYHFVTCKFEFENIGSSDETVTAFSFDCYADGASCDQTFAGDDTLSATLSAGRKTSGSVIFEVPDNASVVEVEYLTNYWTSNRIVFAVE